MTAADYPTTQADPPELGRKPVLRGLAVLASVIAAIAIPAWQMQTHFGLTAAQFAGEGDSTLRAAPYAFAIWGPIYLWLVLYALFQLWPGRETPRLRVLAWASVLPILGCAAWIVASALDERWASVGIIVVSAAFLTGELVRATQVRGTRVEALLVIWPLALLAGWLTVAAALNLLTVLTAKGLIPTGQAQVYALAGIAAVTLWTVALQHTLGAPTYGLAVAWGLAGVAAAEWTTDPTKGAAAAAGALITLLAALVFRTRPSRD